MKAENMTTFNVYNADNKFLIALKILSLPNFKLRDFDCETPSQALAWLRSLDLRDIRDIYSDMNQAWQELV